MTLVSHSGEADIKEPPSRLYKFLHSVVYWHRTWAFGVSIDQEGEVDGSGVLIQLESPARSWRWIHRWMQSIEPKWMTDRRRDDISDVLVASLLVQPVGYIGGTDLGERPPAITWAEDRLNPRPWRPE